MKRRDALAAFLGYLDDIEGAFARREALRMTALLRRRTATHLPREVREELLLISRLPRETLRAPVRFLTFQHRMRELAKGGERLPTAQVEIPFQRGRTAGIVRRPAGTERRAARDGRGLVDDRNDDGGETAR